MSERCPIRGGYGYVENHEFPKFCLDHCQPLRDKAVRDGNRDGGYDHYGVDPKGCEAEVETSHEGLQSIDDSPKRVYSIVDRCLEHDFEVGEQGYIFYCPNN